MPMTPPRTPWLSLSYVQRIPDTIVVNPRGDEGERRAVAQVGEAMEREYPEQRAHFHDRGHEFADEWQAILLPTIVTEDLSLRDRALLMRGAAVIITFEGKLTLWWAYALPEHRYEGWLEPAWCEWRKVYGEFRVWQPNAESIGSELLRLSKKGLARWSRVRREWISTQPGDP